MAAVGGGEADAAPSPPAALRPAREDDVPAVARLHVEQIGEGFLSSLGRPFLERLYRRICRSHSSFVVVAESGEAVVGFVAGSMDTGELYREFLLRDGVRAVLASPWRLLSSWRRVVETLGHGGGAGHVADAELLAIAVDPSSRGRGIGALLVGAMLGEARRRGAGTVAVVVGADNAPAVTMYEASGFETERRFELHRGTASLVMHHAAPAGPATP